MLGQYIIHFKKKRLKETTAFIFMECGEIFNNEYKHNDTRYKNHIYIQYCFTYCHLSALLHVINIYTVLIETFVADTERDVTPR